MKKRPEAQNALTWKSVFVGRDGEGRVGEEKWQQWEFFNSTSSQSARAEETAHLPSYMQETPRLKFTSTDESKKWKALSAGTKIN